MKQSGFMSLHFLFADGAHAELSGKRVVLHEKGNYRPGYFNIGGKL